MTTRHKNWRWIAMLAAAAVLVLGATFAAACGDDDDDAGNGDGNTPAAAADTPADAATEPAADETQPAAGGGGATLTTAEDPTLGAYLVGPDGLTLYTFTNDTAGSGESTCYDACAERWPPLIVEADATTGDDVQGEVATIERTDGQMQVTYNGMPLYYFASDTEPGDTTGHEVGGVWFVATP